MSKITTKWISIYISIENNGLLTDRDAKNPGILKRGKKTGNFGEKTGKFGNIGNFVRKK